MTTTHTYVLDLQGNPTPVEDTAAWLEFMTRDLTIASSHNAAESVVTRFLGFDARPEGGEPLLYETRVVGGLFAGLADRYETAADALAGHERLAAFVGLGAA